MTNILKSIVVISLLLSFANVGSADSVFSIGGNTGFVSGNSWSSGFPSGTGTSSSSSSSSSSSYSSSSGTGISSSVSSSSRNDDAYFKLPGQIKQAVADGMINGTQMVFRSIADSIFSLGGATLATANNATLSLLVSHDDYLNNEIVTNARGFNAWWFFFLFSIFAVVGALLVWKRYNDPLPSLHSTGLNGEQYASTIVWGLVGVGTVFLLQTIFDLEYILSYTLVSTSLNQGMVTVAGVTSAVTLIPAAVESTPALIAFAVIFLISILYFYIRAMIITLVTAYFLFLMGLGLFPFLQGFVKWVFAYALILLFSRPVIDVIIVQGMKLAVIMPASFGIVGKATAFLPYLVLGVIVIIAELCFLLVPIFGLRWIENKIKYVAVAV